MNMGKSRCGPQDVDVSVLVVMIFTMPVFLDAQGAVVRTNAVIITFTPPNGRVYNGDTVTLTCKRALEIQPDVAYWTKDGVTLMLDGRVYFYSNYSKSVLYIEAAKEGDDGVYACVTTVLSNGTQLSSHGKRLHVKDHPFVSWQEGNVSSTIQHKNVTIRCESVGTTTLFVLKNGHRVRGNRGRRRITHSATQLDLEILNVRFSDAGQYICFGSDGVETSNSSIRLAVHQPPRITNITITSTNVEHGQWALLCETEGKPKPTVKWKSQKAPAIIWYENPLVVDNGHVDDNYTCIAENVAGEDSSTVPIASQNRALKGTSVTITTTKAITVSGTQYKTTTIEGTTLTTTEATNMSSTRYNNTTATAGIAETQEYIKTIIVPVIVVSLSTLVVVCCCICMRCKNRREISTGVGVDRRPTNKALVQFCPKVAPIWEQFARILGPKPFEDNEIEIIQRNHRGDVVQQAKAMLQQWKSENKNKATVKCLCKAMCEVQRQSDAEEAFGYDAVATCLESYV